MNYADVEKELSAWAKAALGIANGGSVTPADLEARLPFVRVSDIGGTDNTVTDFPTVDVDIFAATRDQARDLAETLRTKLAPRTRLTPGGAIIDSVRTSVRPRLLPWDNSKIKRYGATYNLGLRR